MLVRFLRHNLAMLWLIWPLVLVILVGYFVIPTHEFYLKELGGFLLMTISAICLILLFSSLRIFSLLRVLAYFTLAFFAFVKLSFYMQYGTGISASALYVIFETNSGEATDYLSNYFSKQAIAVAIILAIPLLVLIRTASFSNRNTIAASRSKRIVKTATLLFIMLVCLFFIRKKFPTQNIPYATWNTWGEYTIAKQQLKDQLAQPLSPAFKSVSADSAAQTYVVVIGESASRWHMQLYGYGRETNPELTAMVDELVVMDSVITPHVHTITALDKILTLADWDTPSPEPNGSIIQLANQAGFQTYWVSNQKPVGIYESIPTILGSAANETRFLATDDYNHFIYDEHVLTEIEDILKETQHSKKLIFVHLIGSHLRYEKRYPKDFDFFTEPSPYLKFNHTKAIAQTNAYDNSIRYTDHVLAELIGLLKTETHPSALVYFSDHGDEVYDTFDFVGHNDYHGSRPMYEVPMFFWFSNHSLKRSRSIYRVNQQKPYSLEHFPHTFAQFSGIYFDQYDASKSVLDSTFIQRTRRIKDQQDYDAQKN
ncbi:MAG: sulfatase-like hydrolase/transferase [Marinirhabdus sp.]|nr:sulfatase-like hydrolase/transferase [Marinirhabdus sp.]